MKILNKSVSTHRRVNIVRHWETDKIPTCIHFPCRFFVIHQTSLCICHFSQYLALMTNTTIRCKCATFPEAINFSTFLSSDKFYKTNGSMYAQILHICGYGSLVWRRVNFCRVQDIADDWRPCFCVITEKIQTWPIHLPPKYLKKSVISVRKLVKPINKIILSLRWLV